MMRGTLHRSTVIGGTLAAPLTFLSPAVSANNALSPADTG
jgi:hypothetical protein